MNWVSIVRVVACFPQASLSLPAATAADSETPCVWSLQSDLHKQSWRAAPRAWQLILPSEALNLQLPSGTALGEIARWQAGAQTKLCGVSILFKSVTDAKFEPSKVTFLILMPSTATAWFCSCSLVRHYRLIFIVTGEAALRLNITEKMSTSCPQCPILNTYQCVNVTCYKCINIKSAFLNY